MQFHLNAEYGSFKEQTTGTIPTNTGVIVKCSNRGRQFVLNTGSRLTGFGAFTGIRTIVCGVRHVGDAVILRDASIHTTLAEIRSNTWTQPQWTENAATLNSQTRIYGLCSHGGALFGGAHPNGLLFRWNGVNAWEEVAPQKNSQTSILSLCSHDVALFGGTATGGRLFRWNGTNAWEQVADVINSQTGINALCSHGGALFGGTYPNGRLFRWNGTNAWEQVANDLNSQTLILSLCSHDGALFGGTGAGGRLFRWNGTDAWEQVANALNSQAYIYSLCSHGGALFGGTSAGGRLFRWNGTDAWEQVANALNSQTNIYSLCSHDGALFGGTGAGGRLFRWNGTDAWVQVADALNSQTLILSLCSHDGALFGGTGAGGRLLQYTPTAPAPTSVLVNGIATTTLAANLHNFVIAEYDAFNIGSADIWAANQYDITHLSLYDHLLTTAEKAALYIEFQQRSVTSTPLVFAPHSQNMRVSFDNLENPADGVTYAAGQNLINGARVDSGSFRCLEDATGKYLECVTNGVLSWRGVDLSGLAGHGTIALLSGTPTLSGTTVDTSGIFSWANNILSLTMTAGQLLRAFTIVP